METLGYLKDQLQMNIPRIVTMAKRGKSYPDKFNPGQVQYFYTFHLADGPDVKHYAREREEESLKLFQPGETLQVVMKEGKNDQGQRYGYLVWTDKDGAEARSAANPQPAGNTRMASDAKKLEDRQHSENEKWAKKDIAQTLGMLTKLFYDSYAGDLSAEARFSGALLLAKKCRPAFTKAIDDCYKEDVLGLGNLPKPVEPRQLSDTERQTLAMANEAFAPDTSSL